MDHQVLDSLELQLCDIQGRLFELSLKYGYKSPDFILCFMTSETSRLFDLKYDRLQWAGEEYVMENLIVELGGDIRKSKDMYSREVMYWTGYTYRYWHFLTGESSAEIYEQADAETMNLSYLGFHTLDVRMAIEDLKELHRQKTH